MGEGLSLVPDGHGHTVGSQHFLVHGYMQRSAGDVTSGCKVDFQKERGWCTRLEPACSFLRHKVQPS